MPGLLDVTVLGPVRAWVDGGEVPIRGRLGRTVLAALALESGRALSVEQLIDALWGELPPATARQQVHIQVSRLRAAFGRAGAVDVIRTEPGGYRLVAHRVDVREVARLREAALAAGHPDAAAAGLRAALELWRGVPLGGISGCLAQAESPRLDELFLCLVEERVDAELAGGHAAGLVPELTGLVGAHPFRESLAVALVVVGQVAAPALLAVRERRLRRKGGLR
jgi:DNA-binding SARP family transcriptional activator